MAMIVRGKTYLMPSENGNPAPTGREIIAIEDHFGLDGLTLLSVLGDTDPSKLPGYTKIKGLYSLAWICLTRGGEIVSLADVLNDYGVDEFEIVEEPANPDEATS